MRELIIEGLTVKEFSEHMEATCSECGETFRFNTITTLGAIHKAKTEHQSVCQKARLVGRGLHYHYCDCGARYTCGSLSCDLPDDSDSICYSCRDGGLRATARRWIN